MLSQNLRIKVQTYCKCTHRSCRVYRASQSKSQACDLIFSIIHIYDENVDSETIKYQKYFRNHTATWNTSNQPVLWT